MADTVECPLARELAARLRESRNELTARWLQRIVDRVALAANQVFPTDDLLDHMPLLVLGIADFIEDPARPVTADSGVVGRARELGALRYAQGFAHHEILKEYEIFGAILLSYLSREAESAAAASRPCTPSEVMECAQRLHQAVSLVQQATATEYLLRMQSKLTDREEQLRAFNRALTHEFRNRIGAASGAASMLAELPGLPEVERRRLAGVVRRNVDEMAAVLENLLELSRSGGDARQQRHVYLADAAAEAARQLREMARANGVAIRIAPDLPDCEVGAAVVELCLVNLISNAIKYADPDKAERWVEVSGRLAPMEANGGTEVVVEVRDNGRGVPEAQREGLFQRFFRAPEAAGSADGTGLGLSIVRESVERLGGRVWADFPPEGAVFAFSLPCRRRGEGGPDAASAPEAARGAR